MAEIVFGVATSHSPQLSTPLEEWQGHAERDRNNKNLHFRGQVYDYNTLLEVRKQENLAEESTSEKWVARYEQCEQWMETIHQKLVEVSPDILVVIGDDQREMFKDDGMPTFSVFWGEKMHVIPLQGIPPSLEPARWANFGEREESFDGHPGLGKHLVESLIDQEFDVTQLTEQPPGRGIGHSFIFTKKRLMGDKLDIPMVPVTINTYYPPNQPRTRRCYQFGQAIRKAVQSWPSDQRVAIVASGGLSHFVVDQELDLLALEAMQKNDLPTLDAIPESHLTSGTSEIKNWVAACGACEHLHMELLSYIPAYRTPAGTGCGMAFAWWQ
jgi:hypothetical protein